VEPEIAPQGKKALPIAALPILSPARFFRNIGFMPASRLIETSFTGGGAL